MTQQLFDRVKVGSAVSEVSGKTVPQHMRAFFIDGGYRAEVFLYGEINILGVEFFSTHVYKQVGCISRDRGYFLLPQILFYLGHKLGADRNESLFVPFAQDFKNTPAEVKLINSLRRMPVL